MRDPFRTLLRTRPVWLLSGLTWTTAVYATNGMIRSVKEYISFCQKQVAPICGYLDGSSRILDFGTGLGGNLLALAPRVASGIGLDVNPLFLMHAQSLMRRLDVTNTKFMLYGGRQLPRFESRPNRVISFGVFERIPFDSAQSLFVQLANSLAPGGMMFISFLSERTRGTAFTSKLGEDAYVYWSRDHIESLHRKAGLRLERVVSIGFYRRLGSELQVPVADLCISAMGG